jgi:hypothetical protein
VCSEALIYSALNEEDISDIDDEELPSPIEKIRRESKRISEIEQKI